METPLLSKLLRISNRYRTSDSLSPTDFYVELSTSETTSTYDSNLGPLKQRLNSEPVSQTAPDNNTNYVPDLIVFGHADLIDNKTIEFIKANYPDTKLCQWFLDRMDSEWRSNRDRFTKKMHLMDANFCTTDPKSLNFKKNSLTLLFDFCKFKLP